MSFKCSMLFPFTSYSNIGNCVYTQYVYITQNTYCGNRITAYHIDFCTLSKNYCKLCLEYNVCNAQLFLIKDET